MPQRGAAKDQAADFMLSQESIKHFEQVAELETKEEREKLKSLEKNRKEFAKQLRQTQDEEFRVKQDQTKQDRLKYLLKQSEIFTHFILQNKKGPNGAMTMADIDMIKQGKDPFSKAGAVGGKSSVSKRHMKKQKKGEEFEDDGDEQNSD